MLAVIFHVPWVSYFPELWRAVLRTLAYTAVSFVGASLLGLGVAMARLSTRRLLRIPASVYTELFKNVPLLAIIFVFYFGLPSVGITWNAFESGSLALVVFYAAYLSEIFRSAISGVHHDQREAAQALGLSRWGTFAHIVFPQALRLALPGTNTMLVDLLKATSLLVTIAAAELMTEAQLITSATFQALEVYLVIALIYFCMCYPLSQMLLLLERKVVAGVPLTPGRRRRMRTAQRLLEEGGEA